MQDMKMHYPKAELYTTTLTRWNGVEGRDDGKPYELELYSGSDWASCKITRRSTSSGFIFLNVCCVRSHSCGQASISLSSMEAKILAATSLLVEVRYHGQAVPAVPAVPTWRCWWTWKQSTSSDETST